MLDFYLIDKEKRVPEYPEKDNLEFVSAINLRTFTILQNKNIIDSNVDFYSDFRWNSEQIHKILEKINVLKISNDTDCSKLLNILAMAVNTGKDLVTFSD